MPSLKIHRRSEGLTFPKSRLALRVVKLLLPGLARQSLSRRPMWLPLLLLLAQFGRFTFPEVMPGTAAGGLEMRSIATRIAD